MTSLLKEDFEFNFQLKVQADPSLITLFICPNCNIELSDDNKTQGKKCKLCDFTYLALSPEIYPRSLNTWCHVKDKVQIWDK